MSRTEFDECFLRVSRVCVQLKVEALVISSKDSLPIKQNVSPWNSARVSLSGWLADVVVDVRQKFRRSPAFVIAAKLCGPNDFTSALD